MSDQSLTFHAPTEKAQGTLIGSIKETKGYVPEEDSLKNILSFTGSGTSETAKFFQAIAKHQEKGSPFVMAIKLANHVARGEQKEAAEMLALNPVLALKYTDVTDYSGRIFKCISAVEYVVWARDHHMLWMIIDKIEAILDIAEKADLITKLLKQVNEVTEKGVTYTVAPVTPKVNSPKFDTPICTQSLLTLV